MLRDTQTKGTTAMNTLRWIEGKTFWLWLSVGALVVIDVGEENMYGVDEFGYEYFAKHEN